MVLTCTDDTVSLNNLTELADKSVEVATLTMSAVQTPQLLSEVEQLWSEVTRFQVLVKSLSTQCKPHRSPTPTRQSSNTDELGVVITRNMVRQLTSVDPLMPRRQTTRPLTSGGA